ncbi:MAG: hypothetical protein ABI045_00785 [Flavobacteriales bacterium]
MKEVERKEKTIKNGAYKKTAHGFENKIWPEIKNTVREYFLKVSREIRKLYAAYFEAEIENISKGRYRGKYLGIQLQARKIDRNF